MDITSILDLSHSQSFSITKENTDGATLPGAKFGLYNSEGELVQNMNTGDGLYTTDYQGKATFDIYADGNYTLKEVKALAGYDVNSKVYNVVMKNGPISTDLGSGNVIIDKKASSSSSTMNTVLESTSKPNKDTETSMKVPSTASKISYVNKSMEIPVSVIVSSKTNTMVEGSISSEISNGSSSKSIVNKPTLVSSSIDIPVRSWSNLIKDESSAVSTNSPSGIPNKESSDATSIKSSVQASTATTQNTAVINNTNKSQYKPRWSSGCGK